MLHAPRVILFATTVSLMLICIVSVAADDWSRFRGANGSGISESTGLPVEFGPGKSMLWETSVPFGRSSPIIAGDRIFLTAVEDGKLLTLALDRKSGEVVWRRTLKRDHVAELYKATDSATPTPVADEANVYVFFHEAGLVAYDHAGEERWRLPLGPFRSFYGIAASPVISGGTLFLLCDQAQGSFLLAVDTKNGKELWRRNRPARLESYSTPILVPGDAAPGAVVVAGSRWIDAYDRATGKSLWALGGVGSGPIASPVLAGTTLFIHAPDHAEQGWSPFSEITREHDGNKDGSLSKAEVEGAWLFNHFGWLDVDANGTISAEDWEKLTREVVNDGWGVFAIGLPAAGEKPKILWNYRKNVPSIPSPLVYDDVFYMVKDGIVTSLDPKTGELLKRDQLDKGKSKVYASPVAADGKIYIGNMDGRMVVLEAGPEWKVLTNNDLGDEIWASPAIADRHIYVRTKTKIYDFAAKAKIAKKPRG